MDRVQTSTFIVRLVAMHALGPKGHNEMVTIYFIPTVYKLSNRYFWFPLYTHTVTLELLVIFKTLQVGGRTCPHMKFKISLWRCYGVDKSPLAMLI
jgi:hypothetical protein